MVISGACLVTFILDQSLFPFKSIADYLPKNILLIFPINCML